MELNKRPLLVSLVLSTFLAAVEGTIVILATPTIVRELSGFSMISLVFSVYLLAAAISTPIYGKLADLFGRKKVLSAGIMIFLAGSFLCGLSQNMLMLITFRGLQGLGAGSIFTVSYTIIGDVFAAEERPAIQGVLSLVWGIASLAGPFLGGFIIDVLSWHWIFFINIPFGIVSVLLLQTALQGHFQKRKPSIDYGGTVVLSLAVILFMSIFLFNQEAGSLFTWPAALLLAATLLLLAAFYRIERTAPEPIVPFEIFTRTSVIVNLISFLVFAVLMGYDVYIPLYLQDVLGYRPTLAGLAMMPMSVSWLMVSLVLGRLLTQYGPKAVTLGANIVVLISAALLLTLEVDSSIVLVLIYGFIIGLGFGGVSNTLTIVIQDSVDYGRRGTAVAANSLLRTLGQTIGISIFGSVFNHGIARYFDRQGMAGINPANLYQSATPYGPLPPEHIQLSLTSSLHGLFMGFVVICSLAVLLSLLMPAVPPQDVLEIKPAGP